MAINITIADIKSKAMIPTSYTGYDSAISKLISDMQPALEYEIHPVFLEDVANSGLQSTLKLGILEIMTGEFIEQLKREFGKADQIEVGGIKLGETVTSGTELITQGRERLACYTKTFIADNKESQSYVNKLSDPFFAAMELW